jgi:signal transduction histidine kinase
MPPSPGIPEADRELIWERFARLDDDRSRTGDGRGLGLAMVKDLTAAHGGSVSVASRQPGPERPSWCACRSVPRGHPAGSQDQAGSLGKHRWPLPKKIIPPNGRWLFAAREVGQAVITLAEDGNLAGPMRRSHPWGLPSGSGMRALLPR